MPLLHDPRRDCRTRSAVPGSWSGGGIPALHDRTERWLDAADTDPDLTDSIVEYVRQRGTVTMEEATIYAPITFRHMVLSQDKIGWRRFLEGMILMEITSIQRQCIAVNGLHMSLDKWCTGLITRLLEITHGQWLYRNYIVHDPVSGTIATARKRNY